MQLLWPIADITAGRAASLTVVSGSACFGSQPSSGSFRDVACSGVPRPIVLRTATHGSRFLVFILMNVVRGVRMVWSGIDIAKHSRLVLEIRVFVGHAVLLQLPTAAPCARGRLWSLIA